MDADSLVSIQEAAAELGVSESAIRNATLQGRLPFVLRWKRKLVKRSDLEEYRQRTQAEGGKRAGRPRSSRPD